MTVGIRHADHMAPSIRKKLAITSPTSGGRSIGIVRLRTQTMEFIHEWINLVPPLYNRHSNLPWLHHSHLCRRHRSPRLWQSLFRRLPKTPNPSFRHPTLAPTNPSQPLQVPTRTGTCPPVHLNSIQLHREDHVKYRGFHLDRRLNWRNHIFAKRKQLKLTITKMHWLLGRKSRLSLSNKILLYKTILKPIWTYGIQLRGTASTSNVEILERFQSKALGQIVDTPWYVPNTPIHRDLHIPTIRHYSSLSIRPPPTTPLVPWTQATAKTLA
jgi:hypothetical protein